MPVSYARFEPSSRRDRQYEPLLHTTSKYGHLQYGTRFFRETNDSKNISHEVSSICIWHQNDPFLHITSTRLHQEFNGWTTTHSFGNYVNRFGYLNEFHKIMTYCTWHASSADLPFLLSFKLQLNFESFDQNFSSGIKIILIFLFGPTLKLNQSLELHLWRA